MSDTATAILDAAVPATPAASQTHYFAVPAGLKVGDCADRSAVRYGGMGYVALVPADEAGSQLVATDGKILAVVPVTCCPPTPKPVLLPAKACNAGKRDTLVEVNGQVRHGEAGVRGRSPAKFTEEPLPDQDERFPAAGSVLRNINLIDCVALRIDAGHLARLAKAISPDGCVTLLLPANFATKCQPLAAVGANGVGAIMPLQLQAGERDRAKARFKDETARLPEGRILPR